MASSDDAQDFMNAGNPIDGLAWLSGEASGMVINQAVSVTRNRPHPWSTHKDYTTWEGLTDPTYLGRHLPAADVPRTPPPQEVQKLFQRPAATGARLSKKSTCLFPAFAQYLTDGFIRTDQDDATRTTTNHQIDLCSLYGRTTSQTAALRLKSENKGERGRLKSQMIGDEEFPLFLNPGYPGGKTLDAASAAQLDPPLFGKGRPKPPETAQQTHFAVGGDRVNSTPYTSMMNTLLLREHNRIAGELENRNNAWDDERVFQTARNIMIPMFIKIVVEQYINHIIPLPLALRCDPSVAWNANWNRPNRITAEFSLLYRWHPLMPDKIDWSTGSIPLANFQLDNSALLASGLDAAFSAASRQPAGQIGAFNTSQELMWIEVRAVMQARGNRLDTYNKYREAFKMPAAKSFDDISKNKEVSDLLRQLYGKPDNVEFYPGLFCEDITPDAPLPGLMGRMVAVDAFTQAYTNPLLSEHVFNAGTFTNWGFDLIHQTGKLGPLLKRNVTRRSATPIEMTQADWRYLKKP